MTDKLKTLVIHLDRATGRRAQVEHIMGLVPGSPEILPACDGRALSTETIDRHYTTTPLYSPAYPFTLTHGEIGCFLSHRATWQKIVDDGLPHALVFEDDVQIDPEPFAKALTAARQHIDRLGFIQFQIRGVQEDDPLVSREGDVRLVAPEVVLLRMSAQLISHAAAKRLLLVTERFDRPVDTMLQMIWETGVPIACVWPSGVSDRTHQTGGSTLSRRRSIWQKLRAEVLRWRYRRKIKRLSYGSSGSVRN